MPSIEGVFGQYGTLIHNILERYAKGELVEFELSSEYKNNFSKIVTEHFPHNNYVDLGERYYNQGLEFFNNFEGFGDIKILDAEQEYFFKIGNYNFTGKIDLECVDQIIDHKTKGELHVKRLTKKHNKNDYIQMVDGRYIPFGYFIQQYTYCIPYKEKYGVYPKKLSLNMVRINDWYEIEFNMNDFERAKQWLIHRIEEIYKTEEFVKGTDVTPFWCNCVCSQRLNCVYSDKYLGI